MKNINILSLVQAYSSLRSLQNKNYANFLKYYGIEIKNEEIDDLTSLVKILNDQTNNKNIFNQFYVGYTIPQIGKEFDLLRFGRGCTINIELKKTSTEEKIQKQLKRNKYYLSFTGEAIHHFCFQSDIKKLFYLSDNDELKNVDFSCLINLLGEQKIDSITNIDNLFNPSNYLVSPFNSTEKFIKNEYFLTKQQEEIKSKISKIIENKAKAIASFFSITGGAGTGKTLLTYDIAKELSNKGKKSLIVHCGILNRGQHQLINDHEWSIIPIQNYLSVNLSDYDVVIIDEAQRIKLKQLEKIVEEIQRIHGKCIFSYDELQTLSDDEKKANIGEKIKNISLIESHELTRKIRTNKEIALFIKALFNSKSGEKLSNKDNIELNYFESIEDAKNYLGTLDDQKWNIIYFTSSRYNKEHHQAYSFPFYSHGTSHNVIGQEFENVVIAIDEFVSYDKDGKLIYRGKTHYDAGGMLYQNITRTRKRLNLVIINNSDLLHRCVSILSD